MIGGAQSRTKGRLIARSAAVASRQRRQVLGRGALRCDAVVLPRFLVVGEEEQFVFFDWTADIAADLVLPEDLLKSAAVAVLEEIVGVQVLIS